MTDPTRNTCPHCDQPLEEGHTCEQALRDETERREYYKRFHRATPSYSPQEEQER